MGKSVDQTMVGTNINFEQLFDGLPSRYIVIGIDDPAFTILAQSQEHARFTMVKPEDVIGRPVLDAFPDTSEQYLKTGTSDLLESFRKVIKTKKKDVMPLIRYDIKNSAGEYEEHYWRLTHVPAFDKSRRLYGIIQLNEDVTHELSTDKALNQTANQLERALAIANIGTWRWNITSDQVTAGKNMSRMFGLSYEIAKDGILLNEFADSLHAADRSAFIAALKAAAANKDSFNHEFRTVSKDGAIKWINARGQTELDQQGAVAELSGVAIDITDIKQTNLNNQFLLHVSRELASPLNLQKTLSAVARLAVPDIADWCSIEMLDEQGVKQQVAVAHKDPKQVAWAKNFAKERQQSRSNEASMRVIQSGKAEFYPIITDELLVASSPSEIELKLARDLGLCSLIIVPLIVQTDTVGALSLILTNNNRFYADSDLGFAEELASRVSLAITNALFFERTQAELKRNEKLKQELQKTNDSLELRVKDRTAELEKSNRDLGRSNQELQDFAYVASHDLQEPLRKIQAFGDLLQAEYRQQLGDGEDYLNRMRKAAARMSTLIQDLLSFSRVTTHAREFTEVDLSTVLEEVQEDLETRIQQMHGHIEADNLPTITADPTQMRQLFQNLLGNALKFHKPDTEPVIRITCKQTADKIVLSFADNGVGFDEKYLDRIFAVFQRLHGREVYEGTGIGLAVCRKITERHGGSITAKSQLDKGSTFIVTLATKRKRST